MAGKCLVILLYLRLCLAPYVQPDRRLRKAEGFAEEVFKITFIRKMHKVGIIDEQHERGRIRALQIAIALWILAPIPLIAFALLMNDSPHSDFWAAIGVVLVLALVATGLGVLLPQTWAASVASGNE